MSYALRWRRHTAACRWLRVPATTRRSVSISQSALQKAGADLLLVLPPYYSGAPEAGLFDFYAEIGHATPLPMMVYSRDWAVFSPEMVARLCDRVPTLKAWKDGQGNGRIYQRIMQYNGDRLAWYGGLGDDCVPTYFAAGVQAYTSSISNISPKVSLALAEAGLARDFAKLDGLMRSMCIRFTPSANESRATKYPQ